MIREQTVCVPRPDWEEQREDRHLLVWSSIPAWMVVDNEFRTFLRYVEHPTPLGSAIRAVAQQLELSEAEVAAAIPLLLEKLRGLRIIDDRAPAAASDVPYLQISNVTLNVTNRCNLSCSWCYNRPVHDDMAPMDVIMDAVAAGKDNLAPGASLMLLGGEPFLEEKRLFQAIERGQQVFDTPVMLSTNGTLISDRSVALLAGQRVSVQVSLDSAVESKNAAVRGPGTLGKVIRSIERLRRANVSTVLCKVYTSEDNEEDFEAYLDLASDLGVTEVRFIPLRLVGRAALSPTRAPNQMAAFRQLSAVLERRPELASLLGRDFFSIAVTACLMGVARHNCGVGERVVFVDADGAVYPCPNHRFPRFYCGNLLETTLATILMQSEPMRWVRSAYTVERMPICSNCPFRLWCAGDCRGEIYQSAGNPEALSPHCGEYRELYPELLWLISNKKSMVTNARTIRNVVC